MKATKKSESTEKISANPLSPLAIFLLTCYNILKYYLQGGLSMGISTFPKKQKFLAGVACSLIVLQLISVSRNADLLSVLGSLLAVLVLLKFLLQNWHPHRMWLGGLLGLSLVKELWDTIQSLPDVRETMSRQMDAQFGDRAFLLPPGFIDTIIPFVIVFACIGVIAINPYFYLLLGTVFKKKMEKTAGVFSAIRLGFLALTMVFAFSTLSMLRFNWSNDLPQLLIPLGYTILYFSWPVLSRPILQQQKKEIIYMDGITFEKNPTPKQKPADQSKLGFGQYFTDHMFLMTHDEGQGWHDPRIVPYGPIALDPAAMCLHYGQEVFEGMKAYCGADGKVRLFRPEENMARLNSSNERLCIPLIDEAFAVHAIEELVKIEKNWIPTQDGASLYIRPFIFAVDPFLGVRPASQYIFAIILSPVGAYYASGLNPVKIFVEQECVRAVRGGTGYAKAGGNYAGSLKAQKQANAQGYAQVLWLDGIERRYIEEVGAMNVFFAIGDEIVTPELQGSILGGITRKSCIEILRAWGYTVNERPLAIDEVIQAAESGALREAFGTGTAAVVSPIGELSCGGETIAINNGEIGGISQKLYDELTGIQWGKAADPYGWTKIIA